MLKCEDKDLLKSAELLYKALLFKICTIKIIDFGFGTTISYLTYHREDERNVLFPLEDRLLQYGCISEKNLPEDTDIGYIFYVLCQYDFSLMTYYTKQPKILEMIEYFVVSVVDLKLS